MVTVCNSMMHDPNATGALVVNRLLAVLGAGVVGVGVLAVVSGAPKRHQTGNVLHGSH
tara:strand:+ start:226 stop:399 length:174 start_codon:yes stop_codon:yes gene_type:complete